MKTFVTRFLATIISFSLVFSGIDAAFLTTVNATNVTPIPTDTGASTIDNTSDSSEVNDTNSENSSSEGLSPEETTEAPVDESYFKSSTGVSILPPYDEEGNPVVPLPEADINDPNAPAITANNAIVMDVKTGTILYSKNAYDRCYPASITKVMTCLVAMENVDLNSTVTFSNDAIWGIERDSNHIALDVGEQITAEQCFYGILLQSANEASWGMAEHVAGSLDAFADMMNAKATEIGCLDSHFVNANGLHDENHYTTCYDMALITKAAIENPIFRTIDETTYYQIPPTNICEEPRDLWHQLKMLYSGSPYYYEFCEGGKTGYTDQAHNTLTTYAQKNGMELVCVMMNCKGAANTYKDSAALYEYYFNNYTYAYPLKSFNPNTTNQSDYILSNFYQGLDHDTLNLSVDSEMAVVIPLDSNSEALTTYATYYDTIDGNIVGNVAIYYDGNFVGQSDIRYNDITVDGEVLSWGAIHEEKKKKLGKVFIILGILVILSIIIIYIIMLYRNRRYRYLRRRNRSNPNRLHF